MTRVLFQYSYLQVLDFLTTVAFLTLGVREGNPLVRLVLALAPNPLLALVGVKVLAVGLGAWCWYLGRERILTRVNYMFALVVAWNLVVLIVQNVHVYGTLKALKGL